MKKNEKLALIHSLGEVTVKLHDLEISIQEVKDKIWLTQSADDPFQTLITGNLTEQEYIHYNKPQGFVWNPKIHMWIRHTGPCQNCGWQPGDSLHADI